MPTLIPLGTVANAPAHTGDTLETCLAFIEVPGNILGPIGFLQITLFYLVTNNANLKTFSLRLAPLPATVSGAGNQVPLGTSINAGGATVNAFIRNLGVTNQQSCSIALAETVLAVDTTQLLYLSFNGQLAVGTDSIQLRHVSAQAFTS